ncbi:reverse transcriptase domain-containing protein [Tanacetum coccineum]
MCKVFKNVNSACPKDYYPLPKIDMKIESVMGFPFKCFLDAYKGYHQIQMSLVDSAFQTQLRHNLESYVDDMVIKSMMEQEMIMDIAETFNNLRKVNMKLNPKKCSFGIKEGKFLGYMVTSEGIRANPKKTKAVVDMQSPKILKEMQMPEETLYVYLATSQDTVSGVLMADYKGKQTHIWLHQYFEVHSINIITDQPIRQILNKPEVSRKLAKYAVELRAYIIMYVPQNAIKGQVLADFINEIPIGTKHLEICGLTDEENLKEWTLYTDEASILKGVGIGLVAIDPIGTEYTYANNEAKYEALLAGL